MSKEGSAILLHTIVHVSSVGSGDKEHKNRDGVYSHQCSYPLSSICHQPLLLHVLASVDNQSISDMSIPYHCWAFAITVFASQCSYCYTVHSVPLILLRLWLFKDMSYFSNVSHWHLLFSSHPSLSNSLAPFLIIVNPQTRDIQQNSIIFFHKIYFISTVIENIHSKLITRCLDIIRLILDKNA